MTHAFLYNRTLCHPGLTCHPEAQPKDLGFFASLRMTAPARLVFMAAPKGTGPTGSGTEPEEEGDEEEEKKEEKR